MKITELIKELTEVLKDGDIDVCFSETGYWGDSEITDITVIKTDTQKYCVLKRL